MEAKLNAILVIVFFVVLSLVGFLAKVGVGMQFDLQIYFWYTLLLSFALIFLGRPIVLLLLDLIKTPYRSHEDDFPVPGRKLRATARDVERGRQDPS